MQSCSLFDDAFIASGFSYLSDIHYIRNYEAISNSASRLDANMYSLEEWNGLITYATGYDVPFATVDEAHQYLIDLSLTNLQREEKK